MLNDSDADADAAPMQTPALPGLDMHSAHDDLIGMEPQTSRVTRNSSPCSEVLMG